MRDPTTPLERKLTAILYADVAGYSRLTEADEERTHRLLSDGLDLMTRTIERYGGKVGHYAGDAILAEFPSVVLAVACALRMQSELARSQLEVPEAERVRFRIGVNLGDVIVDRGEVYGEGVNVAARLEALAEPGGVAVSDLVRHEIHDKLPIKCIDMGEHRVKNISEPLRVFKVTLLSGATLPPVERLVPRRRRRPAPLSAGLMGACVALLVVAVWYWYAGLDHDDVRELALPAKPSLAVLPFKNLSGDATQEYFARGITDDLTTDLSKLAELFVIAGNSSALYADASMNVADIAGELGVHYILKGSLRRTPSMLRVNVQLLDAKSGASVWAERYDAEPAKIFDLQDLIVAQVVKALVAEPQTAKEVSKQPKRPADIDAYDLFLQGWAHYQRETPEGYSDAIPLLNGAIERDPTFHRPHAVLAAIYYLGRLRRWYPKWGLSSHEAFRLAYQHLERANQEPSALGLSVSALMHIHNGRHEQAAANAREATELDANDATAQIVLARALAMSGKAEKAMEHVERAMRLNPHFPASYDWTSGLAHFVAGDYEAARVAFERAGTEHSALDLTPMLANYGHLAQSEDAATLLELQRARWQRWHPGHPFTARSLAAEFPPFLREADQQRLYDGLTRAMATRVP